MNQFKFITSLLLLSFLFSCGIIKRHNEYVSVDSSPRGLEVYRQIEGKEEIEKVGLTPMFLSIPKNSDDIYLMKDPKNEKSSVNTQPESVCRYAIEGEKFIPDNKKKPKQKNVFSKVWQTFTAVGGARFECITVVRAKIKKPKAPKEPDICRTYLIMPPKSSYQKVSVAIAKAWVDQVFNKKKKKCDKVITPKVAEEFSLFLGIDELDAPNDITELDYYKFIELGAKFKATDIVFLPFTKKDKTFSVSPKIYDIHKGEEVKLAPNDKYSLDLKVGGGYKFTNLFFETFRLLPNGVSFLSLLQNRLKLYSEDNGRSSELYDKFKPDFALDNLQYPQYRWHSNFRLVPHFVWQYWGANKEIDVYALLLDLKWFWHLPPGGVLVARAGVGATYLDAQINDYRRKVGTVIGEFGLEFYFFPFERVFINLGYRRYIIPKNIISYKNQSVVGEGHGFVAVGWFWPELRTAVRRWLHW